MAHDARQSSPSEAPSSASQMWKTTQSAGGSSSATAANASAAGGDGTAASALEGMLTSFLLKRAGITPIAHGGCAMVKNKGLALMRGLLCAVMWLGDTGSSYDVDGSIKTDLHRLERPLTLDTANGPRRIQNGSSVEIPSVGTRQALHVPGSPNLCSFGVRVIDEGCALHWLPPSKKRPESECYMILPSGERVDFLIHQKVPYLAGGELTEVSMALIRDESLAQEFFERQMEAKRLRLEAIQAKAARMEEQLERKEARRDEVIDRYIEAALKTEEE